jgi:hypothetical protein
MYVVMIISSQKWGGSCVYGWKISTRKVVSSAVVREDMWFYNHYTEKGVRRSAAFMAIKDGLNIVRIRWDGKEAKNHHLLIMWLVIKYPEQFKKIIEEKAYLSYKSVAYSL